MILRATSLAATNFASMVDSDTPPYFLAHHDTAMPFKSTTPPVSDLRSAFSAAKSATLYSANSSASRLACEGAILSLSVAVPLRYLAIRFASFQSWRRCACVCQVAL